MEVLPELKKAKNEDAAWKILNKLKADDLLDSILEGIEPAIEVGKEIVNEQPKAPTPMWQAISDVKIMLWSFNKIGDEKRIAIAYRKCMNVTKEEDEQ